MSSRAEPRRSARRGDTNDLRPEPAELQQPRAPRCHDRDRRAPGGTGLFDVVDQRPHPPPGRFAGTIRESARVVHILSYLAGRTERIGLAAESWCSRSATRCWWLSRQRPFTTSAGGSATGIKTSIPSARLPLIQTSESDLGGPAVDEQLGAGDETRIIRSEEGDGFRGFLRAAQTAHGCG